MAENVLHFVVFRQTPRLTRPRRLGAGFAWPERTDLDRTAPADDGRLRFACSCPVRRDGALCKHCVAVALTWLRDLGPSGPTLDDAHVFLESLPHRALVQLLIDQAHEDDRLARRLLLMATRPASGARADAPALRALIDQVFAYHGFVSYREVYGYVRGIEETIDVLDGLRDEGRADEVIELAEHGLAAAERALDHVDDSDGQIREVIERLEELHIGACRRGTPDPDALAQRLFTREVEGECDVFDRAVVRYADVLADAGLARYRKLAEARWATVPKLAPGEDSRGRYGARFRITRIMEALAELSGSLADQIPCASATWPAATASFRSQSCVARTATMTWHSNGPSGASRHFAMPRIRACARF